MAKRALIRKGDRTTHGGEVLSGDETYLIHGKAVARVGDLVSCPRCRGTHRIVTGAPTMFSGSRVGRHDDVTDCGAKLIASQATDTLDDGSEGASAATLSTMPVAVPDGTSSNAMIGEETLRSIRFQAIDPATEQPLAKRPYVFTREDGTQHGGLTDAQGFTNFVNVASPEHIAVHFMFANSDGATIERQDLLP